MDRSRIIDDIIYYKGRIYLVPESTLKRKIIQASHDSPLSRHQGFLKTYRQIRERFSWKGLKEEVMQHIRECSTTNRIKSNTLIRQGYFIHYRYRSINGKAYRWNSLQGYPCWSHQEHREGGWIFVCNFYYFLNFNNQPLIQYYALSHYHYIISSIVIIIIT